MAKQQEQPKQPKDLTKDELIAVVAKYEVHIKQLNESIALLKDTIVKQAVSA